MVTILRNGTNTKNSTCNLSLKRLKFKGIVRDSHWKFVGREEPIQVINREISSQRSKTVMGMNLIDTIQTQFNSYEETKQNYWTSNKKNKKKNPFLLATLNTNNQKEN